MMHTLIPLIFARLLFSRHKFRGTFPVFLMKNVDQKGKKETKLELLLTFGVLSSQNLHLNGIFNLSQAHFARN